MTSKLRARRTMPEAIVPYLRMSGRWLEEHGFVIGTSVQVVVEHGRVTLISDAVADTCELDSQHGSIVLVNPAQHDAHVTRERVQDAPSRKDD